MNEKLVLKKVLNVSGRFVDYYLHGERRLSPRRAKHLADYLGVPITHILFPEDYGLDIPAFLFKAIAAKQATAPSTTQSMDGGEPAGEETSPAMSANGDQEGKPE